MEAEHGNIICFNPRSHEGSDGVIQPLEDNHIYVSIHAPTKGATQSTQTAPVLLACFNPRSHEGSDNKELHRARSIQLFQSTLPRRERHGHIQRPGSYLILFQSTLPRRERHEQLRRIYYPIAVSIHAPTKGATCNDPGYADGINMFQSTLPRRERPLPSSCLRRVLFSFNPRSHEGSDFRRRIDKCLYLFVSIHAPTKGATQIIRSISY